MKDKLRAVFAVALCAVALPLLASPQADQLSSKGVSVADIFGRIIYIGGGSTNYQQISPMVIKPYSRRNIELGYVVADRFVGDKGVSLASGDDAFTAEIKYVMVDCVNKTFSPYPEDETNMGMIAYRSGSESKWGDYERLGFDSYEGITDEVNRLLEDACTLSEKF